MIGCDFCEEWFHPACLSLSEEEANQLTETDWKCPVCEGQVKIDYEEEEKLKQLELNQQQTNDDSQILPSVKVDKGKEDSLGCSPKRTKVHVGPGEWMWLVGDKMIAPSDHDLISER